MDRSIWRREMKKQARILLAAPKSGSGKTLFTCGLLAAGAFEHRLMFCGCVVVEAFGDVSE